MAQLKIERTIGSLLESPHLHLELRLDSAPMIDEYTELISAIETIVGIVERSQEAGDGGK